LEKHYKLLERQRADFWMKLIFFNCLHVLPLVFDFLGVLALFPWIFGFFDDR